MPLSEFDRVTTKAKLESTQSKMASCTSDVSPFMPDHDFAELLWENGQIVMRGQSDRPKKSSFPTPFPSHNLRVQEKDGRDFTIQKFAHFEAMNSTVNELLPAVPCANIGLNAQDDDMTPWINYPMENPLCSEFFSDLSGINPNPPSTTERNNGFAVKEFHNVENGHSSKALRAGPEPSKFRANHLFPSPQQCQSSAANTKSRLPGFSVGGSGTTSIHQGQGQFQKQDIAPASKPLGAGSGIGVRNFSHFSRHASVTRANTESLDRLKANEKVSVATASTAPMESALVESSGARGNSASDLRKVEIRSAAKAAKVDAICVERSEAVCPEDATWKNHQNNSVVANNNGTSPDHHFNHQSSSFAASVAVRRHEAEKGPDAIVASSSVCSGNSAGAASNYPNHRGKKRNREEEDSGYHSDDLDDESTGLKKPTQGRGGTSTKRSRAAEVHNLSERRRRDRINEKMRALQELIPNCNKVDKASMLDEAIEYLKTLQLQIQMMSMGSGLCMPPMMLPPGMQHIRAPPMAHFSPMGIGMGMGMGLNYGMGMLDMNAPPSCPLIPVSSMHTSQFPCSSIPGTTGLHGIPGSTGLQLFGIPGHGQGLPMLLPRAALFSPLSGLAAKGSSMNEATGSMVNPIPVSDVGPSSRSKDQLQQQQCISLEATQKTSNSQPQGAKELSEQAHLVQMSNQMLHANGNAAANSVKNTGNASSR